MESEVKSIGDKYGVEGLLITDSKGFQIFNNGFSKPHRIHALFQLSQFFFPSNPQDTLITIETAHRPVYVRSQKGNIVAIRDM